MRKVLISIIILLLIVAAVLYKPSITVLPDYHCNDVIVVRWLKGDNYKEATAFSPAEAEVIHKWLYMKYRIYK